ncbi:MAG TPA: dihydrofolate reductase [Solirubrobacteraceae bacterium]|jgi:dihydrofolate reductase|nr:dihydrofolate reductase [Solirubrobacteraceae bacterium]
MVAIVVARAGNGVIGRDGGLPWRLPSDMRRFRELTSGHTVVMGRRTFESIPDRYRPLPHRRNLVLSASPDWRAPGAEVFADLAGALDACDGDCFVIGGERTYREALPLADRVYATEVEGDFDGDVFFPGLAPGEWRRVEQSERVVENEHGFTFCVYERERALEPAV